MEVEVVDAIVSDWPRRLPRPTVNWSAHYRKERSEDQKRLHELTVRLREAPREYTRQVEVAPRIATPTVGFVVSVDGHVLGKVGTRGPGTLSVAVYLNWYGKNGSVNLGLHGGQNFGAGAWRWRRWKWEQQSLRVGQKVRVEIVDAVEPDAGETEEIDLGVHPETVDEIRKVVREVRKRIRANRYSKKAAEMARFHKSLPPPRSYRRVPIHEG